MKLSRAKSHIASGRGVTPQESRSDVWSESEIATLHRVYVLGGMAAAHAALPHRSRSAIGFKARQAGLKPPPGARSAAIKAALADPAVRAEMSAAKKAAWADPAVRAKMSAASKAALADPAVRAKMSAAIKAAWADPAVRAKRSAASKAALADPAVRAKRSAAIKAALADLRRPCFQCLTEHGRRQRIDGIPGEVECVNVTACEERILRAMAAAS
jgi:hypothetical protein